MSDNSGKLFSHLQPKKPANALFDRIISAIKLEQELRQTKRILIGFLALLMVSVVSVPFSGIMLWQQLMDSGFAYFISTAFSNLSLFATFWQDVGLAMLESVPIMAMIVFIVSLVVATFTLRLFLYKKGLLAMYVANIFSRKLST